MPHAVLDVVAEEPKHPHVTHEVEPPPVEEDVGNEGPEIVGGDSQQDGPAWVRVSRRNEPQVVENSLQGALRKRELEKEDDAVYRDHQPSNEGAFSARHRIANWNQRKILLTDLPAACRGRLQR